MCGSLGAHLGTTFNFVTLQDFCELVRACKNLLDFRASLDKKPAQVEMRVEMGGVAQLFNL